MAHYAQVINNVVTQVLVGEADVIKSIFPDGDWVQTSYNTYNGVHLDPITRQPDGGVAINKNYASIGDHYDGVGFYNPPTYPSWGLNTTTYQWEPPIPYPTDGNSYSWNETTQTWDNTPSIL